MKVSELIKILQLMPQDIPVYIRAETGCCCGECGTSYDYSEPCPSVDKICTGYDSGPYVTSVVL